MNSLWKFLLMNLELISQILNIIHLRSQKKDSFDSLQSIITLFSFHYQMLLWNVHVTMTIGI
jgi:hypothetical protein